ncbi:PP2C family protein-serine/threonine phosphatase [Myxococcus sp. NMCA1]|uniref:PP2C family protein-serine/threonine phosphatase n=1 Tax=Myxococcus sp. NMCA1 TaxID=2996785 RepID=UPI002286A171|nr:PP2C family serine/threonine-protein phosphatase [Myxococcus sp. NMCA1]WAM23869.1 serine/threonine-protein phosphatase [Myxococcus sp. NMCA1]
MSAATQVQPLALAGDVGACTERGLRSYQEDAVGYDVGANVSVFAVADGLGGHPNGDLASRAAVDSVLLTTQAGGQLTDAQARSTVARAEVSVLASGGSTTLALLMLAGSSAVVAHVGDSRVYRLRCGVLEQLTQDHRIYRHVLNRCLGATSPDCPSEPDVRVLDTEPGDVWVLATDGVSDTLGHPEIRAVLRELPAHNARWAAEELVRRALDEGSTDNCTTLVVLVGGGR